MIGQFNKFVIVNNTGYTITFNDGGDIDLSVIGFNITPATGKIAYAGGGSETFGFTTGSSLADGAEIVGTTEFDNTSDLCLGYLVEMDVAHDLAASCTGGTIDLYLATGTVTEECQTDASGYQDA